MKTKIYKTKKGIINAIRQTESTPPANPIKGKGNLRAKTIYADVITDIVKKRIIHCNHVATVYARRSQSGYTKYGADTDYISPEMDALLEANKDLFVDLVRDWHVYRDWKKLVGA